MKLSRLGVLLAAATFAFAGTDRWLEQMTNGNRLRLSGDLPGAEKHYLAALDIAGSLGEDHTRYGQTLNNLAGVYQDRQDYAKAEPLLLRSLAIQEKALGPAHLEVITCLMNLGVLYDDQARFTEAEAAYLRAITIGERQSGEGQGQLAVALGNLGALYLGANRFEAAEASLVRGLTVAERVLGLSHRQTVRITLFLANLEYKRGRYSQAESGWLRALSAIEDSPKPDRITAATVRMNLAELKRFERRFAESESLLGSAIEEFEGNGKAFHPLLPAALNHLALTRAEQGNIAAAERTYLLALAILVKSPDAAPARKQQAVILHNLARLREEQPALSEAADLFRRALENAEVGFGPDHPWLRVLLHDYTRVLRALRRSREADALEHRAKNISAPGPGRHTVDLRDLRRLESGRNPASMRTGR